MDDKLSLGDPQDLYTFAEFMAIVGASRMNNLTLSGTTEEGENITFVLSLDKELGDWLFIRTTRPYSEGSGFFTVDAK